MTSMYNGFYSKNTFIWTSPITPPNPCRTPIASSTILAVVLLKLGGYGIVWLTLILKPLTEHIECPFLMLSLWGIVMASSICLREANLKSLIAYSSVSHIALVITAVLFQTPWSFTEGVTLIIVYGLTLSLLFCLANRNYEWVHSQIILLTQGFQTLLPLIASWWLLANLTDLALPAIINLVGELFVTMASFSWSNITIVLIGLNILITP